jgi:hypothetical protein
MNVISHTRHYIALAIAAEPVRVTFFRFSVLDMIFIVIAGY